MVAARAPVIDLTLLDPLKSALGRLPARPDRGPPRGAAAPARRRPPVAAAPDRHGGGDRAAHLADAAADVTDLITATAAALMKLSEAISEAYFRQAEMVETEGDAPA